MATIEKRGRRIWSNVPKTEPGRELDILAAAIIGDGKEPDLFFVSIEGDVELVTTNWQVAYDHWANLPATINSDLENRTFGVICSCEEHESRDGGYILINNARDYLAQESKKHKATT